MLKRLLDLEPSPLGFTGVGETVGENRALAAVLEVDAQPFLSAGDRALEVVARFVRPAKVRAPLLGSRRV